MTTKGYYVSESVEVFLHLLLGAHPTKTTAEEFGKQRYPCLTIWNKLPQFTRKARALAPVPYTRVFYKRELQKPIYEY
jgi:hypothetical protein